MESGGANGNTCSGVAQRRQSFNQSLLDRLADVDQDCVL
jgi:hypothetical protein